MKDICHLRLLVKSQIFCEEGNRWINMGDRVVLIVGGYGIVGREIARMLHDRYPDLQLRLGGRTKNPEMPFQSERVRSVIVDNTGPNPLKNIVEPISIVINAANDPEDNLLKSVQEKGVPFIDITRFTKQCEQSHANANDALRSPVILASGWMAGTAALYSKIFAEGLEDVVVNIHALYSLQDKAGPNSIEYMDRLTIPFYVTNRDGKKNVYPMTEPHKVKFPNGYQTKCYRLDTPDHLTVLRSDDIVEANFRIGFDKPSTTFSLVGLTRSGIWNLISGNKFKNFRKKILHSSGQGSPHYLVISIKGKNRTTGELVERIVNISDPKGQTHLTAIGVLVQVEHLLHLEKYGLLRAGTYFPEFILEHGFPAAGILRLYSDYGVTVTIDHPSVSSEKTV
jgi:hypothetical protein